MNKITLIGNLTRDPELSRTPSGLSVCKFDIAVGRNYTDASGNRPTDFFRIVAWRGLGENCSKYLRKGKKACIVGTVQMGEYTDKDGVKRRTFDVIAEDVEFLSPKDDDASVSPNDVPKPKRKTVDELKAIESDDLPF